MMENEVIGRCGCCSESGDKTELAAAETGVELKAKAVNDNHGYHNSVFYVLGLDCADCAAKLEQIIRHLAGVRKAVVNFAAGKLLVEHTISDQEIINTVQQAGYQAVTEDYAEIGRAHV
jgi:Cd2+/Zn2+-exporting ATPase